MILGIGIDTVSVARVARLHTRYPEAFAAKILSVSEFAELRSQARPASFLAKRFAAKEAFAKALGSGIGRFAAWREISVGHDEQGRPVLDICGATLESLRRLGVGGRHLSISDERDHAMAVVVLETQP